MSELFQDDSFDEYERQGFEAQNIIEEDYEDYNLSDLEEEALRENYMDNWKQNFQYDSDDERHNRKIRKQLRENKDTKQSQANQSQKKQQDFRNDSSQQKTCNKKDQERRQQQQYNREDSQQNEYIDSNDDQEEFFSINENQGEFGFENYSQNQFRNNNPNQQNYQNNNLPKNKQQRIEDDDYLDKFYNHRNKNKKNNSDRQEQKQDSNNQKFGYNNTKNENQRQNYQFERDYSQSQYDQKQDSYPYHNQQKSQNSSRTIYQSFQSSNHQINENDYPSNDEEDVFYRDQQHQNPQPVHSRQFWSDDQDLNRNSQTKQQEKFRNDQQQKNSQFAQKQNFNENCQQQQMGNPQFQQQKYFQQQYQQNSNQHQNISSQKYQKQQQSQNGNNQDYQNQFFNPSSNKQNFKKDNFEEIKIENKQYKDVFSITFSLNHQMNNMKQKVILVQKLISQISSIADLEIKFTAFDPNLERYLPEVLMQLNEANIEPNIEYFTEEKRLIQQRIYQMKKQSNLTMQEITTFLYFSHIQQLIRTAEQYRSRVLINSDTFQFKIMPSGTNYENYSNNFYTLFKNQLDQIVLLSDECQSKQESLIKVKILQNKQIKQILQVSLKFQEMNIYVSFQFKKEDLINQFQPFYSTILQNKPKIIIIGKSELNNDSNYTQTMFTNFIQKNIQTIKEEFEIILNSIPDSTYINQKLNELQNQNEYLEIIQSDPQINLNLKKYIINYKVIYYQSSMLQLCLNNNQTVEIKKEIENIYFPLVQLNLETKKQIMIWEKILSREFEDTFNPQECQTKYVSENLAIIELRGEYESTKQKKIDIQQKIMNFDIAQSFFHADESILEALGQKLQQQIFIPYLKSLATTFGNSMFSILKIIKGERIQIEIIYDKTKYQLNSIEKEIQDKFISQLMIQSFQLKMEKILDHLKLNQTQIENQYKVIFLEKQGNSELIIMSVKVCIQEIEKIVEQIKLNDLKNQQTIYIQCPKLLVFNSLKKIDILYGQDYQDCSIAFTQDQKIMATAHKDQLQGLKLFINSKINEQEKKLQKFNLNFTDMEVKYIRKNLQVIIDDFKNKNPINIEYQVSQFQKQELKKSIATQLNFEGKDLQIIFADISRIECDAIVNSCNDRLSFGDPTTLSGVASSIFEMAGSQYHSFCEDYINRFVKLKVGDAIAYEMPKGKHIKYIINVATPIYSSGNQTNQDLADIGRNIKAIFQEADSLQIQSLALPIFGGGACGFSFGQASDIVLREVINQLFSNKCKIKTVYITETMDSKISELQENLQQLLQPSQTQRQVKYQWQWQKGNKFVDYDDEEINKQIDEAYEKFLETGEDQTCSLKFPFTKQPGTHIVDLDNKIVTDVALQQILPLSFKYIKNSKQFYFGDEQVCDILNEYLVFKDTKNERVFSIFYKNHVVYFAQEVMVQINSKTQFIRSIQYTPYICKNLNKESLLVLQNANYQLNSFSYKKKVNQANKSLCIQTESFDKNLNQQVIKLIQDEIQKVKITLKIQIPFVAYEELQSFELLLLQNCIQINGIINQGESILVTLFEKKKSKIEKELDSLRAKIFQYPSDWIQQNENCLVYPLKSDSSEYKKIEKLFQNSTNGKVYEIHKIQNKVLWENYQREKNKLIDFYKQANIVLDPQEQSRYLWHGVKNQHPQIIYKGQKEAFDSSFCQEGTFGLGIYFALNASYSKSYAYKLQHYDDQVNQGKQIFLCCLVTTGKVEQSYGGRNIRRPTQGYDCVSSNDGTIFVLYQMDVRRAYPAYAIIFQ